MPGAEEAQRERTGLRGVAVRDDGHGVAGRGRSDPGRGEDRHAGVHRQDAVELVRGPVVAVFVRDDDGDRVRGIRQGRRERTWVDEQPAAGGLEDQRGMLQLREFHALS
jgi:hypothetical protein